MATTKPTLQISARENAATALAADAASAAAVTPSRAYLTASVDTETGDVTETSRFKYLPGHPRQIRFDAKAGVFNIGGDKVIGKSISIIPMALRIFSDNILNMGRKIWAELFFVDDSGAVCAVLFHGYSVENLQKLNASLFYDDLKLTDVVLTVSAEKKQTIKNDKPAIYFIAEFNYDAANAEEVAARQQFAADFDIYRDETVTGAADLRISENYRLPEGYEPTRPQALRLEAAPGFEEGGHSGHYGKDS